MKDEKGFADLPAGFTAALLQNGPAMSAFAGLDEAAREALIARARAARSQADMKEILSSLSGNPPLL